MTISTRIIGGYAVVFFMFLLVVSGAIFALNLQHKKYGQFIDTRAALADGASDLRIAVSSQLQHYHGMFLFSDLQQHYIRDWSRIHNFLAARWRRCKAPFPNGNSPNLTKSARCSPNSNGMCKLPSASCNAEKPLKQLEIIKQASAQNMAGTKQAEIAAQSMQEIGVRLKRLVER